MTCLYIHFLPSSLQLQPCVMDRGPTGVVRSHSITRYIMSSKLQLPLHSHFPVSRIATPTKRPPNPLCPLVTHLTFTTSAGNLIDADAEYDSRLDEHSLAQTDRAKCSDCKPNTIMAPAANKDLERYEGTVTSTKGAPVTEQRKPFVQDEDNERLKQAGEPPSRQPSETFPPSLHN